MVDAGVEINFVVYHLTGAWLVIEEKSFDVGMVVWLVVEGIKFIADYTAKKGRAKDAFFVG